MRPKLFWALLGGGIRAQEGAWKLLWCAGQLFVWVVRLVFWPAVDTVYLADGYIKPPERKKHGFLVALGWICALVLFLYPFAENADMNSAVYELFQLAYIFLGIFCITCLYQEDHDDLLRSA